MLSFTLHCLLNNNSIFLKILLLISYLSLCKTTKKIILQENNILLHFSTKIRHK